MRLAESARVWSRRRGGARAHAADLRLGHAEEEGEADEEEEDEVEKEEGGGSGLCGSRLVILLPTLPERRGCDAE